MDKIVHGATPAHVHVRQPVTKYTVDIIPTEQEKAEAIETVVVTVKELFKRKINWEGVDNGEQESN